MPGHINRTNSKVRFAPNSEASFEYPKSFNADSSADITVYENFNENPEGPTSNPGSSLDIQKPLLDEPLMQANRTADHFNIAN